jgi:hypothetical protein
MPEARIEGQDQAIRQYADESARTTQITFPARLHSVPFVGRCAVGF